MMPGRETRLTDHAWQAGRQLKALSTDYFRLDERSQADLVAMAVEYARLLTYFEAAEPEDENGSPKLLRYTPPDPDDRSQFGVWESFFRDDVSFLLAQICMVDAAREYRDSLDPETDLAKKNEKAAKRLDRWCKHAAGLTGSAVTGTVEAALVETLEGAIDKELIAQLLRKVEESEQDQLTSGVSRPSARLADILEADARPRDIYSALNRATDQIVKVAGSYLTISLEEKRNHPPHAALYLTFISLLQKSQTHLNSLTERHLRFYYEKVLRMSRSAAEPDRADVSFQLSPQMWQFELPAGTELSAGDTPDGPVIYRTDEALAINRAEVVAFKALNVRKRRSTASASEIKKGETEEGETKEVVRAIRAFPVANSADGFGGKLDDPSAGWLAFGARESSGSGTAFARTHAEIGIAFAAPILNLSEGERQIELLLSFSSNPRHGLDQAISRYREQVGRDLGSGDEESGVSDVTLKRSIADAFLLSVSTKSGFRAVSGKTVEVDLVPGGRGEKDKSNVRKLRLRFTIEATEPPLEPFGEDATEKRLSDWPVLKLQLNPEAISYAYSALNNLIFVGAQITVRVRGLRTLNLQSNQGPLDAGKPFPAFGAVPVPGAYFLFANRELWGKRLTKMQLNLCWANLPRPPDDLASHYADYGLETQNDSFRGSFSLRSNFRWQSLAVKSGTPPRREGTVALFAPVEARGALASRVSWELDVAGLEPLVGQSAPVEGPLLFDETTASGFFRLELTDPDYGFGHAVYPGLLAEVASENAKASQTLVGKMLGKAVLPEPLPNPPLVPLAENVSLDYEAIAEIGGSAAQDQGAIYHLHPFGQMTATRGNLAPFGAYQHDGYLFLGLRDLRPPQTLTLLVHLHESEAEQWSPASGYARPSLSWFYLAANRWVPLPNESILADRTGGLLSSGIVKLALPADISDQNTILSPGLFWLAIAVDGDVGRYGRIVSIATQAVTATRVLVDAATRVAPAAAAGTIRKFVNATPQIAAVSQPCASTGGRAAESESAFRIRVSERLRHKQRAVQPGDLERLVLEAFPEIHEARCIPYGPGHAVVVVTPVRRGLQSVDQPRVALKLRHEISAWLHERASAWAEHIEVRSPSYETVKIVAHVAPSRDTDASFIRRLEQALGGLIAPWRSDLDLPMAIGTGFLDLDAVHAFMEDQSFVHEVAGLSMVHCFRTVPGPFLSQRHGLKDTARHKDRQRVAEKERTASARATLRAATPWSVLVPASRHDIRILGRRRGISDLRINADFVVSDPSHVEQYRDDDSQILLIPTPAGIGNLAIGQDFVVTTCADAAPSDSRFERGPDSVMAAPLPQSSRLRRRVAGDDMDRDTFEV